MASAGGDARGTPVAPAAPAKNYGQGGAYEGNPDNPWGAGNPNPFEVARQLAANRPPDEWTQAATKDANARAADLKAQTQANRPNVSTPFGNQSWSQDANGNWTQSAKFGGQLGGANDSLQSMYANALKGPLTGISDIGAMGQVGTGDQAREQAINSAWGQATSRLDPMWAKREEAQRTSLLNQGLDPGSEASKSAMSDMGMQRNDAYTSAMASAIANGDSAGNTVFQNNLSKRNSDFGNQLSRRQSEMSQRGQGFGEQQGYVGMLGGMQGLLNGPGFNASGLGNSQMYGGVLNQKLGWQQGQNQQAQQQQQAGQDNTMDWLGAGIGAAGVAAGALPFLFGGSGKNTSAKGMGGYKNDQYGYYGDGNASYI